MNFFRTTKTGYRFDKRIFWASMILMFSLLIFIMYQHNFNFGFNPHLICKDPKGCNNPFVKMEDCRQRLRILFFIPLHTTKDCRENCEWCKEERLPMGEYGTPPSPLFNYIKPVLIVIGLLTMGLNHFIHNRGKKFNLGWGEYVKEQLPFLKKIKFDLEDEDNNNGQDRER